VENNAAWAPYYFDAATGVKNFDCLNPANNRPPSVPLNVAFDGRVYNLVWRTSTGSLLPNNTANLPEMATWRQNMATLSTSGLAANGGPFGSTTQLSTQSYAAQGPQAAFTKVYTGGQVCQQGSATSLIGCVVGNTRCTIGFAGREAADRPPADDTQEAIRLPGTGDGLPTVPNDREIITDHYPISRSLFVNAVGGFENISADCLARGGTAEYCSDEAEFIRRFYAMGTIARDACTVNGFIPVVPDAAPAGCGGDATCNADMAKRWTSRCQGSVTGETGAAAAGCGRINPTNVTLSSGKVIPYQDPAQCDPDGASPATPPAGGVCTDLSTASGADGTCG
jgi:hypothetical protein